ncbi:uncharacterized protein FFNC_04479 [Fusarium fujikuroi]|nr:uncharacterized protein FFNC_04479 [Fusarium fujikuroi]SCV36929.1 uncharacterized protein FFFS_05431 [Fusarium fujikuroi]
MSGLEPLVALGLVCNIVQLVEVGLKTATLCKNAYRTGDPDPELSVYAQNLAVTASSLSQSLEHSQQPLNLDDSRLLTLARDCCDAEAEWRKKTPARFLSQQQPRRRDRFGAVLRGFINKPEIDRLESQLQKTKESLGTDLLTGVFKRLEISKVQTDDLRETLQNLLRATSASEAELHNLIQAQVALINTQLSDRITDSNHSQRPISHQNLSSHRSTFHWIFHGGSLYTPHPKPRLDSASDLDAEWPYCSTFVRWLKSPVDRYWISGRPGTGKSVLMKFIVSHPQTVNSLRQWQPDYQILVHFFWKVGSPMQSSFKGFLCSLVYQLCALDKGNVIVWLQKHPDWSRKTGPGDWDNKDLQSLATSLLCLSAKPFCLFIDGLDEVVDDDGVCTLIGFLDTLQLSSRLFKICMSSRPEQAIRTQLRREPDLRMQDLTRSDIEKYVRATLSDTVPLSGSSIFVQDLVRDISSKSEGVFLWAILVTRSVARGISNGDSKEEIQQRLIKTPKRLYELYLDMWTSLGEDSELYQESTALILKLALFAWRPPRLETLSYLVATLSPRISILEMMLASSHDLWSMPVNHFVGLDATDLVQRCNELCTRLPIMTAGLFEFIRPTAYTRPTEEQMADESFPHLLKYDKLQVQPIHRTVFDFLIETKGGKSILEYHKASQEELFIRIFRSCLLRECLWPEVYFDVDPYRTQIPDEYRKYYEADHRLQLHLHSLLRSTSTMKDSTLTEQLDFIWTFLLERTKGFSWQVESKVSSRVPRSKLDFILRLAPMGFDAYVGKYLYEWERSRPVPSDLINCRRHHEDEETVYVEISVSILVQIFLRHVGQYDAAFNCQEVEEALDLKLFSQTINPTMFGMEGGLFAIPSSADQAVIREVCQAVLLPELSSSSSPEFEDAEWCQTRMAEGWRDISTRTGRTRTQAEIPNGIEEGIGPNGMNFYLCSSCEARETTQV